MSKRYGPKPLRPGRGIGDREIYWDRFAQELKYPSYGRVPNKSALARRARRHLANNLLRGSRARNRPDNVADRIVMNRRERAAES